MNYYAFIPLSAFVINLFLFSYVFATREREPVSRAYLYFVACAMGWELSDFVGWSHTSDAISYAFLRLNSLFWMPETFIYMHFLYLYIRRRRDIFYKLGAVAVSVLTPLALFTDLSVKGVLRHSWGTSIIPGPLYYCALFAVTLIPGIWAIIMTIRALNNVQEPVIRSQLRLLLWGVSLTYCSAIVVNVVFVILLGYDSIPSLGSFLMILQSVFVFIAMVRYRLFSVGIAQAAYDLFSRIHDGVIIYDHHHNPAAVNQHAANFFGLSTEQLSSQPADQTFPAPYAFEQEYRNWEFSVTNNNAIRTARLAQTTLIQGAETVGKLTVIHDITEEKRSALALAESERRFRDVSLSMGDWIWEVDSKFRYTFASGKVKELLGYSPADLLGKTPFDIMTPEDAVLIRAQVEELARQRRPLVEIINWNVARDSRKLCLVTSGVPVIDEDGRLAGYRGVDKDITGKMEAEAERDRLEHQVRHSEASKMEAIGQLAGGIAHDFNNMLGGITALAEVLLKKYSPQLPAIERYASRIVQTSLQASDLIGKLLAYARKGSYDLGLIDAHRSIEDALRLLEHTLDRNLVLIVDLSAKRSAVRGNPTQLQSAILNLALNARDAMPNGGTLTVTTATVSLSRIPSGAKGDRFESGDYLRISVSDTGTGMDLATQQHVFEPFFTTKEVGKGTGLGLASVYGSVMNHNGLIDLASEPEIGTTVTIFLPLSDTEKVPVQQEESRNEIAGSGTILIIDDEALVCDSCAELIREMGYHVHAFTDARKAIEFYQQKHNVIDGVMLDMIMPEMDGYQCFVELKKTNSAVRVLIASGYATDERIQKTLDAGAIGLIHKPFRIRELNTALNRISSPILYSDSASGDISLT